MIFFVNFSWPKFVDFLERTDRLHQRAEQSQRPQPYGMREDDKVNFEHKGFKFYFKEFFQFKRRCIHPKIDIVRTNWSH